MSDFEELREEIATPLDLAEQVIGAMEIPGADLLGVVNAGLGISQGYSDFEQGDTALGVIDMAIGAGSMLESGGEMIEMLAKAADAGSDAVEPGAEGSILGAAIGGLEIGKGAYEILSDEGYGGQTLDGVEGIIGGAFDVVGALPIAGADNVAQAGKAGYAVGEMLAPVVFGDMDEQGPKTEAVPEDGQFRASTGNSAIDWIFGVGDYEQGRF